jgi:hypothetical protein
LLADYPARVLDVVADRLACPCGKLGIALKAREQPRLLLPGAPASGADHTPEGRGGSKAGGSLRVSDALHRADADVMRGRDQAHA